MKRLNGAWLAYWILFLVFEVSIVAYIQRYDRFDQMRIINNWHVLPVDNLFRGLSFLGELLVPIGLLLYFKFKKKAWFCFIWVALVLKKPWVGGIAALLAAGVALSRVYLFQHFPVDVAFGALIGISCSSIFYYLYHETLAK